MLQRFAVFFFLWGISCSHQEFTGTQGSLKSFKSSSGKDYFLGLNVPDKFYPKNVRSVSHFLDLPDAFDWREKAVLSPIEDQGSCGSCWAFSTAATFQDVLRINGVNTDISEQHLLSCAKPGEWSCNGGFFAHDRHRIPFGSVSATAYPYTGRDSSCKSGLIFNQKISSWNYLPADKNGEVAIEDIKQALYTYGPLSVGVAVDGAFTNYRGGIFEDTGYRQLNHAVNLVGWNNAGKYWILRNSWGKSFGEQGWMRIKWGANGVGAWANYIVYEKDSGPTPEPTPEPTPPCEPLAVADTGYGDEISVRKNTVVMLGTKELPGHTYFWTAVTGFDGGVKPKTARIKYRVRSQKIITVHAVTRCGEAKDSVTVKSL